MVESKLIRAIEEAVEKAFDIKTEEGLVMLEIPKVKEQGDYSSNIAMRLTKTLRQNPRMIAEKIVEACAELDYIEKIDIAGPGFINFFVVPSYLANIALEVMEKDADYGRSEKKDQSILLEYVSANPTGRLHIGHARGAAWGDSLARVLDFAGYDVLREYYINDLGNQIKMLSHSIYARYAAEFGHERAIPEDGYRAEDIHVIAKKIAQEDGDKWLEKEENVWEPYFRQRGVELELAQIEEDLGRFGVRFDSWVSEKWIHDEGRVEEALEKLKDADLTYERDGALWFKSTEYGDDKDRVLIKNDGLYTYLVPDIAYHLYKLERNYDRLINLWGGDHHGYIPRMRAALEALGHKDVLDVDIIQMVRLVDEGQEVKMSKRSGNAVALIDLIEDIGSDAARYFFVSRSLNTPLDFDLTLARKQSNENPVFYAQYAHARMHSIMRQAPAIEKQDRLSLLEDEREIELLKYINEFPSVVEDAAATREVQKITNYIQELSARFHRFYGNLKVNDPENPSLSNERLHLVKASQITLRNALHLIGVNAPESM